MFRYDIEDKCVINASAKEIYLTVLDEADGKTSWWRPRLKIEKVNNILPGKPGFQYWLKVTPLGRPRMLAEMIEVQPYTRNLSKLVAGDFVGNLEWSFSEVGKNTQVSVRWQANPNSFIFSWASRLSPMGKLHSQTVQIGFRGLKRFLKSKRKEC